MKWTRFIAASANHTRGTREPGAGDERGPSHLPFLGVLVGAIGVCVPTAVGAQYVLHNFPDTNGTVFATALSENTLYLGGRFSKINPEKTSGVPIDAATAMAEPGFPVVGGAAPGQAAASVNAVAPDGAGGWFIGGKFSLVGGVPRANLAHILPDKTVSAWNPSPNGPINALAMSGSTLYVTGQFGQIGGVTRSSLAAINVSTGNVTSWAPAPPHFGLAIAVEGTDVHVGGQGGVATFDATTGAMTEMHGADGPVNAVAVTSGTIYMGGSFSNLLKHWNVVAIDATTAAVTSDFPRAMGTVSAVAPDGSGGWYIGGNFSSVGGSPRTNLAHVLADYSVADWNPAPNGAVLAIAVSGSTIYVGGNFTTIDAESRNRIAALDATTGQVTVWDPDANASVLALAADGGLVYAAGAFTTIGGRPRSRIAALALPWGQAIGWNPGSNGGVAALAVNNGVVYAGGAFTEIGGEARTGLAALDTAIGSATSWAVPLSSPPNCHLECCVEDPYSGECLEECEICYPTAVSVSDLAIEGSTIYIGGSFQAIGAESRSNIAAVDITTGQATSWNPGADQWVRTVAIGNGVLYVAGVFQTIGGQARSGVAAVDLGTGIATGWNPSLAGAVYALGVQGSVVCAGGSLFTQAAARNNVAALDATTGLVKPWDANANGSVFSLVASSSILYAGGSFTSIGGEARNRLAALDPMTGHATGWNPDASSPAVETLAFDGSTVFAGGVFFSIGSQPRNCLAAIDAVTGQVTPWDPSPNGRVLTVAVDGSTVYAGGYFTLVCGLTRNNLAAVDVVTHGLTNWNPGANGLVQAITLHGSTVYVGGDFTGVGGQERNRIAAVDFTTGQVMPWNPNADNTVSTILASDNAIHAGGMFTSIGGQARSRLAALDEGTGLATAWDPSPNWAVGALTLDGSTLYVGGSFQTIGGQTRVGLAAVDVNSGNVLAWNPGYAQNVTAFAIHDETVYVGSCCSGGTGWLPSLFACDATTGNLLPWSPGVFGVRDMALRDATLYVVGDFAPARILLIDAETTAVTAWSFTNDYFNSVRSIELGESGTYIGGSFSTFSGRLNLAAFTTSVTGVQSDAVSALVALGPRLPNPSSGPSEVRFRTAKEGRVILKVFDVLGREVRTLADGHFDRGPHVARWDGKDERGTHVASGIYFCELRTDDSTRRIKMTVLH